MLNFKILKKSTRSRARLGILKTPHGEVETPCLVPVATQATVKTLTSQEVKESGSQLLICNTYHLHLRPTEKIVKSAGGLHKFMNWQGGLMTDSGGFQVFSLGFGKDLNTTKITKSAPSSEVKHGDQPKEIKITKDGVFFRSYLDGKELFLGPKESIKIQQSLGADIILAFDECPPPSASKKYLIESLETTHRWAKESLKAKTSTQALYGIVQGGKYKDLRLQSAKFIADLPFDGFAIGGEFGSDKKIMSDMLGWVNDELPENKPRHLLGIGYLDDIPLAIKNGVDTFDCIVPTHFARHGTAFTSTGKLDLFKSKFLTDKKPLDVKCGCMVCGSYKRNYICHLLRAREITPLRLLTLHNLYFFNNLIKSYRDKIRKGLI